MYTKLLDLIVYVRYWRGAVERKVTTAIICATGSWDSFTTPGSRLCRIAGRAEQNRLWPVGRVRRKTGQSVARRLTSIVPAGKVWTSPLCWYFRRLWFV
jgi:hypothetical protein